MSPKPEVSNLGPTTMALPGSVRNAESQTVLRTDGTEYAFEKELLVSCVYVKSERYRLITRI